MTSARHVDDSKDRPSGEMLLGQHSRWLRTVVSARVSDPQGVDDVMQELAIAVLRQAHSLRDTSRAAPWLYRIAIRQVLLHRRSQARHRNRIQRAAHQLENNRNGAEPADPLKWIIAAETRQNVQRTMTQLSGQDRELLLLRHVEKWTYQQIADHLGLGVDKIVYRLTRARSRMRKLWLNGQPSGTRKLSETNP